MEKEVRDFYLRWTGGYFNDDDSDWEIAGNGTTMFYRRQEQVPRTKLRKDKEVNKYESIR